MDLTELIRSTAAGDQQARRELIQVAYQELCQLAAGKLRFLRDDALTPTELVHEVAIRILSENRVLGHDRRQFFAYVSRAMTNVLIDRARSRDSLKRRGDSRTVILNECWVPTESSRYEIQSLREAIKTLEKVAPRRARMIALRYYHGHSNREIARTLSVSQATVKRDLKLAKNWLRERLRDES